MLRWSRRALNEGSMGDEFDTLLKLKFAKDVRTAAKKELQALRDEHEGLAGNLYVDASAYASKSGTTGCDKGAARHRGNGVRNVLAMDRCNGCVFANIKTDGSTVCQKYNKNLMDKLPAEDTRAIQREAIRLANASDAERTASLFADTYDPGEFNLSNDMDDFDYSFTPSENLSGIWFEGMPDLDME